MGNYQVEIYSIIGTVFVAVIGLFGNGYLAHQNKKRELLIKEEEIKQQERKFLLENLKKYWEAQDTLFQEVLRTASDLTFIEDIESEEFLYAYKRIWRLLYGDLPLYDALDVERALQEFADLAYEKKRLPAHDSEALKSKKREMKPYLTEIAKSIKNSSLLLKFSKEIKARMESN